MIDSLINGHYYEISRNGKTELAKFAGKNNYTLLFHFVNSDDEEFVMTWDMIDDGLYSIKHLDVLTSLMT